MKRAAVFVAIVTLAAFAIHAQGEEEVVRVDSSLVILNATITDLEGRPVSGLLRDRFSVFEDGVEQKIEFFSAEETPFAAVILIDTSGSMEGRVSMARSAAIRFLAGLRGEDVSSIYHFDSKITLVQEFSDLRDIDERVFELRARGMTALNDAIVKAAEDLSKRVEKRRAIIVLSDGADTYSRRSSEYALKAVQNVDAVIYTVDMSAMDGGRQMQNTAVLKNFAEKTGGRFIATPGGALMRQAFEQIVAELGTQYTIAYDPKNAAKDGKWRSIELRVARKNLYIRTRKGYNAPKSK
jgi:VWFA-related protein